MDTHNLPNTLMPRAKCKDKFVRKYYRHLVILDFTSKRIMISLMKVAVIAALAGMLLVSSMSSIALQAFAEKKPDNRVHKYKIDDKNMDIKQAYIDGTNLVVKVKGTAGGTVPDKPEPGLFGQVFVYVFYTDNGIMVINAHWECHTGSGCDPTEQHVSEWHSEFVTVENVAGYDQPCVTSIYGERPATMDGHFGIVDTPEVTKILKVQTAAFDLQTNPDDPQQDCIAELDHVFDEWTPKDSD